MKELKILILEDYLKIETNSINLIINNCEKLEIKKEDNGKPIILVESKQQ